VQGDLNVKLLVVIQARTSSTRLPGKILLPLAGRPLLQRMIERVGYASTTFNLVIATTTETSDDPVQRLCEELEVDCYRGHPTDLLDRHYQAGRQWNADVVVKIPSDCPLIDPRVIDRVLGFFLEHPGRYDFVSNLHPPTYPDGNDVEVLPMHILELAWRSATRDFEREHTTPYIWERPDHFTLGNVEWETGLNYSMTHRWTIDYEEDYRFVKRVFDELWSETGPLFHLQEIINLLEAKPEIAAMNARYAGVNWYRHHLGQLKTIHPSETRQLSSP
jgi:spore coat polysaccharide biosynthesis protein SpsF